GEDERRDVSSHRPSRFPLVGHPHGRRADEDDGYALAFVHDPDRGAADLVILAAQDFTGEPVARVHLPGRVPLGFHGSWIPDA
ncbi:carotenoid oxygenase family protein, partial [Streptomyces sp. NPDC004561]